MQPTLIRPLPHSFPRPVIHSFIRLQLFMVCSVMNNSFSHSFTPVISSVFAMELTGIQMKRRVPLGQTETDTEPETETYGDRFRDRANDADKVRLDELG